MVRKVPLDDPEIQERMARLNQEQKDLLFSRHYAIGKIVSTKFMAKFSDRALFSDFADKVILPHTFPLRKPGYTDAAVAYLREKAPDLIDEFLAHEEWQRLRAIEWDDAQNLRRNGPR